eukprot:TRINITY_DN21685_c0_g1_i1.p1 TRINITY_DN21685_c0_g1~~TRINITY_DN21685_c0_g1_i1.p1  ORF type:complete len:362 (+),score=48.88 TRINITY_DN21685_c0_g1_i1:132-1217(+)
MRRRLLKNQSATKTAAGPTVSWLSPLPIVIEQPPHLLSLPRKKTAMCSVCFTAACLAFALLLPRCVSAEQVRPMDLLPYLVDSPPTSQVAVKLCNVFKVVEKPYYVLFGSCWVCALLQQLIDHSRYYEGNAGKEELGMLQKGYVGAQLLTLVLETFDLFTKVGWFDGASLWDLYNLYVYMFVHSSVFVRSVMMTMIVWDWYEAKLLKRPVFGPTVDGKGFSDTERAAVLVIILQFGSSAFVMALVVLTHLAPAFIIFVWIFLIAAAFIIKIRAWLRVIGIDSDGRFGRGFVMASNSFVAVAALQTLITAMVRVYVGVMARGYTMPIWDDINSRDLATWYECHLSQGWAAFHDQDFLNLFVR